METIQETAADKYVDEDGARRNDKGGKVDNEASKAPKAIRAGAAITRMQQIA